MHAASVLEDVVWEPFGFLSHTRAHRAFYSRILEDHADLQLCLVDESDDEPVALVNCVPFHYTQDLKDLPQEGWDWLVETGSQKSAARSNVLGALAVSVAFEHRGKGHAQRMIGELKEMAIRRGFEAVVVPVRPSSKWQHPYVSMSDYLGWKNEKGQVYDPWLRSHIAQGASIIGPCERSMVVEEPVSFWETWMGQRFDRSAPYVLKGALAPIQVDLERESGLYEEPNVWVRYRI
jgi:GNAT superfamily N-acetyltransferase